MLCLLTSLISNPQKISSVPKHLQDTFALAGGWSNGGLVGGLAGGLVVGCRVFLGAFWTVKIGGPAGATPSVINVSVLYIFLSL